MGQTLLKEVKRGDFGAVQKLINEAKTAKDPKLKVDEQDMTGRTSLHWAAKLGFTEVLFRSNVGNDV